MTERGARRSSRRDSLVSLLPAPCTLFRPLYCAAKPSLTHEACALGGAGPRDPRTRAGRRRPETVARRYDANNNGPGCHCAARRQRLGSRCPPALSPRRPLRRSCGSRRRIAGVAWARFGRPEERARGRRDETRMGRAPALKILNLSLSISASLDRRPRRPRPRRLRLRRQELHLRGEISRARKSGGQEGPCARGPPVERERDELDAQPAFSTSPINPSTAPHTHAPLFSHSQDAIKDEAWELAALKLNKVRGGKRRREQSARRSFLNPASPSIPPSHNPLSLSPFLSPAPADHAHRRQGLRVQEQGKRGEKKREERALPFSFSFSLILIPSIHSLSLPLSLSHHRPRRRSTSRNSRPTWTLNLTCWSTP